MTNKKKAMSEEEIYVRATAARDTLIHLLSCVEDRLGTVYQKMVIEAIEQMDCLRGTPPPKTVPNGAALSALAANHHAA